MRNKLFILALVLALVLQLAAAEDLVNYPKIRILSLKYEPYPPQPGDIIELWLKFQNYGQKTADNVTVELVPRSPLFVDSPSDAVYNIGILPGLQEALIKTKIRVGDNAVGGNNTLYVRYKTSNDASWNEDSVGIYVKLGRPAVNIDSAKTVPDVLSPGKEATFEIKLKNPTNAPIRNLLVKLDLSATGIPVAPKNTTTQEMINWLEPYAETTVNFGLVVYSTAAIGVYKIPLNLQYYDLSSNQYTENTTTSISISGIPDIDVEPAITQPLIGGSKGKIVIKVVNKGILDLKFMNMETKAEDGYTMLSSSKQYIGSLDSDDYDTAEFDVFVSNTTQEIKFPVNVEYADGDNRRYTEKFVIPFKVYTTEEAIELGLVAESKTGVYLVGVAALVVLYMIYGAISGVIRRKFGH